MLPYIVAVPLLSFLVIFQSAVISRVPLLEGQADLVLLAVIGWSLQDRVRGIWFWALFGGLAAGLVTALPFGVLLAVYLFVTGLALILRKRVWKVPFLAMIASVFLGTLILNSISFAAVSLQGSTLPIMDVLNFIVLPSLLLNLLFAVPMYILIKDIAGWLYPEELKV
jgi:rod shape-determining protein MreD